MSIKHTDMQPLTRSVSVGKDGAPVELDLTALAASIAPHVDSVPVGKAAFDSYAITVQAHARSMLAGKGTPGKEGYVAPASAKAVQDMAVKATVENSGRGEGRDTLSDVAPENRGAALALKAQAREAAKALRALRGKPAVTAKPRTGRKSA
jgi:hypothetical protein